MDKMHPTLVGCLHFFVPLLQKCAQPQWDRAHRQVIGGENCASISLRALFIR